MGLKSLNLDGMVKTETGVSPPGKTHGILRKVTWNKVYNKIKTDDTTLAVNFWGVKTGCLQGLRSLRKALDLETALEALERHKFLMVSLRFF